MQQDPERGWTRERLKRYLVARYNMRFHMSMILASTCAMGMLSSWVLLRAGMHDMQWRYPLVISIAYLTFLCGVWIWLRMAGFVRAGGSHDGSSVIDGGSWSGRGGGGSGGGGSSGGARGGGGTFDGGGASASWAEGKANVPGVALIGDGANGGGDDFVAILLLIALALAIFLASGYLIYMGPDIFTEAAFGTLLAGTLGRHKPGEGSSWILGVVRKTWWPFAIVLVLAYAFASYASSHHPQASTFREVIHSAVSQRS